MGDRQPEKKGDDEMRMIDLCSGLGGASQAMLDHGWDVMRIDNNPILSGVDKTIIHDILKVPDFDPCETLDLMWASPPCLEFSLAYNSPQAKAGRNKEHYEPDMSLIYKCIEIINQSRPKFWVLENVVGSTKFINPILGPPRQIIGSYVLWGNFPFLRIDQNLRAHKKSLDVNSKNPLRANIRAQIPYPISNAMRMAIEEQTSIIDWC